MRLLTGETSGRSMPSRPPACAAWWSPTVPPACGASSGTSATRRRTCRRRRRSRPPGTRRWSSELGRLLAFESRRKGVDVLLAPTVNLHRTPYGGRHFECFSEDPLLTARIGVAYVLRPPAVRRGGDGQALRRQRLRDPAHDPRRARRRAGAAGALSRAVRRDRERGRRVVDHGRLQRRQRAADDREPALRDILHGEWGFDGVVMSDWFATRTTVPSAVAALDLVMPGPARAVGRRARRRGPRGRGRRGADRRQGDADPAARGARRRARRRGARGGARSSTTPRSPPRCAAPPRPASCWRATRACCPLDRSALARVAVVGPNAAARARWAAAARRSSRPTRSRRSTGCAPRSATAAEVDHAIGVTPATASPSPGRRGSARRAATPGSRSASSRPTGRCWPARSAPAARSPGWARSATGSRSATSRGSRSTPSCAATDAGTYAVGGSGVGRYALSVGGEQRLRRASSSCRRAPTSSRA